MGDCPNPRFRPDQNALVRGFHAQYHSHWRAARGLCRGLACHHRARDGGAGTVGCWHLERLVGSFRPARQSGKREPPVTGITHEYGYLLTTGTGESEITAINDHEFLVDERDGKGLGDGTAAVNKKLYKIDITGAVDITNLSGTAARNAAVGKTLFLDLAALLNANAIASTDIPAKIEGLAFGDDVFVNGVRNHTLWIANDNDFVPGLAGPNIFYVIGVTDADLAGSLFVPQSVPEPATLAILGFGLAGLGFARRRRG